MNNNHSTITNNHAFAERKRYVTAFNSTMIKIWREQINLLGVIDTGALYRSTVAVRMTADGKFTQRQRRRKTCRIGRRFITTQNRWD